MESISSTQKNLFINSDAGNGQKPTVNHANGDAAEQQPPLKKHVVKTGSQQTMADAEAIFSRANSYADVSAKVQKNLQAYETVELSQKREAVSKLMGVDIYA
ncbi:hypothetical protein [Glaciecola sp. SC05]|uniref:hypothetical protein n=1 Tax=Glaciecola sp. SC05 TaxID=1987355 RepID=UPI003527537D